MLGEAVVFLGLAHHILLVVVERLLVTLHCCLGSVELEQALVIVNNQTSGRSLQQNLSHLGVHQRVGLLVTNSRLPCILLDSYRAYKTRGKEMKAY
jgi:hypothetical protein